MPRKNKTGVDWSDPEQRKARMRENARRLKEEGKRDHRVTIDGVEYDSQAHAAQALGVSKQAIWTRVHAEWRRDYKRKHYRRKNDPRPERKRRIRITREDAELARRLLLHFPQHQTIDQLFAYALRRLAERTDD